MWTVRLRRVSLRSSCTAARSRCARSVTRSPLGSLRVCATLQTDRAGYKIVHKLNIKKQKLCKMLDIGKFK